MLRSGVAAAPMSFPCPSCSAGHNVPELAIPGEGLEIICRRCAHAFRIFPPLPRTATPATIELPLPNALPPSPWTEHFTGDPSARSSTVSVSRPNNVYERVAKGARIPEEPLGVPAPSRSAGDAAWEEPRLEVSTPPSRWRPSQRSVALARRGAVFLNRAPLLLKVALVVIPVALGVGLVLNAGGPQAPSANTPIPNAPLPDAPVDGEVPAEAYVAVDFAEIYASASAGSTVVARLTAGQKVRCVDRVGTWILVIVPPTGPAGFVSEKHLDRDR